jgi:hypothetical protein
MKKYRLITYKISAFFPDELVLFETRWKFIFDFVKKRKIKRFKEKNLPLVEIIDGEKNWLVPWTLIDEKKDLEELSNLEDGRCDVLEIVEDVMSVNATYEPPIPEEKIIEELDRKSQPGLLVDKDFTSSEIAKRKEFADKIKNKKLKQSKGGIFLP